MAASSFGASTALGLAARRPKLLRSLAIVGELASALGGRARMRTLVGDGHLPHLTHPERYAEDLTAFIRSSCGTGPAAASPA
ncbi:hypothetical protein [Streptomyces roseus]|uniref:Uncharacterized protein n=1 Tax=Streptomyces roseus TaxID=66430 RepID=A0A0J6XUN3_9ACTN|nr:hypothetical protein [Streptomyces roseus]KMO99104.1 hypothetical protein ACS04_03865 [Streptomyces roseus]